MSAFIDRILLVILFTVGIDCYAQTDTSSVEVYDGVPPSDAIQPQALEDGSKIRVIGPVFRVDTRNHKLWNPLEQGYLIERVNPDGSRKASLVIRVLASLEGGGTMEFEGSMILPPGIEWTDSTDKAKWENFSRLFKRYREIEAKVVEEGWKDFSTAIKIEDFFSYPEYESIMPGIAVDRHGECSFLIERYGKRNMLRLDRNLLPVYEYLAANGLRIAEISNQQAKKFIENGEAVNNFARETVKP